MWHKSYFKRLTAFSKRKLHYIAFGALGGAAVFAFMFERTWARYHEVALALTRGQGTPMADIELNVLIVVGSAVGIMLLPIGVGIGLGVAALLDAVHERMTSRNAIDRTHTTVEGSSWVTRRIRRQ